jgi:hypothetical protein
VKKNDKNARNNQPYFYFFYFVKWCAMHVSVWEKKKSLSPCLSVFKNWDGEGKLIVKKMKNMLRTLI